MTGKLVCLLVTVILFVPLSHADESGPPKLSIDANLYPYLDPIKNDTDFTFLINARLPSRFSYFSFQNFKGLTSSDDTKFDRSEQNLRWTIWQDLPVDLNAQGILVDGDGNDIFQLGVGFRLHDVEFLREYLARLNLIYRLSFHVKRFSSGDDSAWQMEHVFRMTFPGLSDRLYLSGFLDQTFDLDVRNGVPSKPIVTEIQFGTRVYKDLYAVAEYRRNDFRLGAEENFALGVEYKFRW